MKFDYKIIVSDVFILSFLSFLIFSIMEIIRPGIVIAYLNLNYLLVWVLLIGIATVWINPQDNIGLVKIKMMWRVIISIIALILAVIIYQLLKEIFWLAFFAEIASFIFIKTAITLLLKEEL